MTRDRGRYEQRRTKKHIERCIKRYEEKYKDPSQKPAAFGGAIEIEIYIEACRKRSKLAERMAAEEDRIINAKRDNPDLSEVAMRLLEFTAIRDRCVVRHSDI